MIRKNFIVNHQYNIGYICTDLQCEKGLGNKDCVISISQKDEKTRLTYKQLSTQTNKFANILSTLGFSKGDVFFTFLPKVTEQYVAFLGSLKAQIITGTLFSNFGEKAIIDRLGYSKAKGIIVKSSLYKKIQKIRSDLPDLKFIIITDIDEHLEDGVFSYANLMKSAGEYFDTEITSKNQPSVLHYTSGSTGKPKGVLHAHGSITYQNYTSENILNINTDSKYWCTADPGWITGTSYGIIGPLSVGATAVNYEGGYKAEKWMKIIDKEKVDIWYTSPTALRMLMDEEPAIYEGNDFSNLKYIFSVGEPLNPEVIRWGKKAFDKEIYDTYFQTETGAIMISNRPGLEVVMGSMGKPTDLVEAAVITDAGHFANEGEIGNLCFKSGWDSMFINYLNCANIYKSKFKNGYYYTGDLVYKDKNGYYWFVGRKDDIINTAGHLISPFEIESALLEMDEISQSAAIGVPDNLLFEKIVIFVKFHEKRKLTKKMELKIRFHLSKRVSSIATPHDIIVLEDIPTNKSGKIMRRVLRAKYIGEDLDDISTMEG